MARMTAMDVAVEGLIFLTGGMADRVRAPVPSEAQVKGAERALRRRLPGSYLEFLRRGADYLIPDWNLYWIGDGDLELRNIVVANDVERQHETAPLPEYLIAFFDDGTDDLYCFDTRRGEDDGEYPVVLWQRDQTAEKNLESLYIAATDFTEWLKGEVKAHS